MSKFKPGDKVRIVSEIPKDEEGVSFVEDMGRDLGKELTIDEIDRKGNYWLKGNQWGWHENWLEPKEKIMSKFKPGDKVRMVLEIPKAEKSIAFVEAMEEYLGEELTIEAIDIRGNYRVKESRWHFHEKWLESIEVPQKVKSLEGVEIGDSIYNEEGIKYYVHNIILGESLPIKIIEIGGCTTYEITKDGRFGRYSEVRFFLKKPKVHKYYSSWYNLCESVNGKVYLDIFDTKDEALKAKKLYIDRILRRAVELTIEYED